MEGNQRGEPNQRGAAESSPWPTASQEMGLNFSNCKEMPCEKTSDLGRDSDSEELTDLANTLISDEGGSEQRDQSLYNPDP